MIAMAICLILLQEPSLIDGALLGIISLANALRGLIAGQVARAADRRQQEAEEQQLDELLREGGVIAHGALRDRATLESLAALRQKLGNGRAGSGANKQLFRLERW